MGATSDDPSLETTDELHHKYQLPHSSFAYVGDASDQHTWKLPCLLSDGAPDPER